MHYFVQGTGISSDIDNHKCPSQRVKGSGRFMKYSVML